MLINQNIKFTLLIFGFCLINTTGLSQGNRTYQKGSAYFYWGWNRAYFSPSTIHFWGDQYDFKLYDVIAIDRQSPFDPKLYFSPSRMTIPQYNFRLGYYFKNNLQISFGVDHMKYVMLHDQPSTINGYIENSGTTYDGVYTSEPFTINQDFLKYEHTDGLNYINFELRKTIGIEKLHLKYMQVSMHYGGGIGMMLPKTNTTLLNQQRHDAFHISGYGLDGVIALQIHLFKYFFVQGESKMGFVHMPDIRTTQFKSDRASQMFLYNQFNLNFGGQFYLVTKKK